jgi:hypothetical protein
VAKFRQLQAGASLLIPGTAGERLDGILIDRIGGEGGGERGDVFQAHLQVWVFFVFFVVVVILHFLDLGSS